MVLEYAMPGPGAEPAGPDGADDLYGAAQAWRNLLARQMPADAVAARVMVEDLSLTPEDWIASDPAAGMDLRSLQEYVGSTQPRCC